ncbi:MAG: hypothetical protein J0L84_14255 [Verrucomicrobia bacterium]|nr:hypothetical protein [Verrucomicrobiota bacterium]
MNVVVNSISAVSQAHRLRSLIAGLLLAVVLPFGGLAGNFEITIGDRVSENLPAPGAGRLAESTEEDSYTFVATAGQLAFFEPIEHRGGFAGRLRWQLLRPGGAILFGGFFSNPVGRTALPESGTYRLRVYTDGTDPGWTGTYSFRVLPIPPDTTFEYEIGTVVSDGVPIAGAGRLEVAGAEDHYLFPGAAGQLVFLRSLGQGTAFGQNLRWQLIAPGGARVFSSFFTNPIGRTRLPEAGIYRLRVFTDAINPEWFGPYSFQISALAADQTFSYTIGTTVSDGVPAVGAGRLEVAGAEDHYVFSGRENQVVFFESLEQDTAFKRALRWQLIRPGGGNVFSAFFTNPQGRIVLPDVGEYRLRIFTDAADPSLFGMYSFSTRGDVLDQEFPMAVGNWITDGVPGVGAGRIETPGSTDTYSFEGRADQEVVFEPFAQAPEFQRNLRWELVRPGGGTVFSVLFSGAMNRIRLPETGTYRLRVFVTGDNPDWVGWYSFRTVSRVAAFPDRIATRPGEPVEVTFDKLLFNDMADDATEVLRLELLGTTSEQGGALEMTSGAVRYSPQADFVGADQFGYRLIGKFGGTNETTVTVHVAPEVGTFATIVNSRRTPTGADFCLLGEASASYEIEISPDLLHWAPDGALSTDTTRGAIFPLRPGNAPVQRFFRVRRQ